MKKLFIKIKNYFTANIYRKIFFFGLVFAIILGSLNIFVKQSVIVIGIIILLIVAIVASLIDSMKARVVFLQKVKEMQVNHLEELLERQKYDQKILLTSTFSDKEKKYINKKKWSYNGLILLKVAFVIMLITLIFSL